MTPVMLTSKAPLALTLLLPLAAACDGWTLDYGEPAAQFEARDAAALAGNYLGQKVTVRGEVLAVDTSDPRDCVLHIRHGVTAKLGALRAMAAAYTAGEVIYVDGIVDTVVTGETASCVVLDPAIGRDPTAPFEPERP
jgi:hypothetical protein